jgi:hypothetical protein
VRAAERDTLHIAPTGQFHRPELRDGERLTQRQNRAEPPKFMPKLTTIETKIRQD